MSNTEVDGLLSSSESRLDTAEKSKEEELKQERAVREGFLRRRVVWFGGKNDYQRDLLFFLENEHTLLSLCRSHAYHQFDRESRITYIACVLCLNFFFAAYLERRSEIYGRYDYVRWLLLTSCILVAYDYALRILATSPCIQQGGSLGSLCYFCRNTCLDVGKHGLALLLIISAGFALAGLLLGVGLRITPKDFFSTFIIMRSIAYITEIIPRSFTFYRLRERQRKYWDPTSFPPPTGDAYPFGRKYPSPEYLLSRRHHVDSLADSVAIDIKASERNRKSRELRAQERQQRADRLFGNATNHSSKSAIGKDIGSNKPLPFATDSGLELLKGEDKSPPALVHQENDALLFFDDENNDDIESYMYKGRIKNSSSPPNPRR